ncbi:PAS domain-containing protein [Streptomyces sp. DSM 41972]|uniref:histidine kinase n=1 Tax=Streptomyces althioticus subsp. attaecolombicae TaxID=3075534 RepID=A0ABU3I2W0_9ACTN|nr:PAS domain-containing protein [Streptomyces sp. DSM 41972]SCD53070.1 two-component system, CitB family, sensor kinase [Streptomyces sp. di188]SCD54631.1 two-component system, CitB family, sensor kinase [Streptomyces sp. di50b]
MTPTTPDRRLRLGLPRRVFSQVLLMQVAIAAGVAVLATGLFLAPLGEQLDDQAMRRALAIAQNTAQQPQIAENLRTTEPTPDGPVQREAERIRGVTGAEYVVVLDHRGVRWPHTAPERVGGLVSTDPGEALAGREVMEIDEGTLGRSARGKVPLRDADAEVIGAVSVGIAYDSVRARLVHAVPGLLAYAGGALAVGALAAWLISRRVQRQTRDLAFSGVAALLAEREAMLHGIREGVVPLDRDGRVRLLNDEAQRLLGIGEEAVGSSPDKALGTGRTADVLAGRVTGAGLLTVRGQRVLVANRMPTDDGGTVAEGWSTKEPPGHRERGIGLPLVRRLAHRHGGDARVDEAPGGGAAFTVVLPEALTEPEAPGGGAAFTVVLPEALTEPEPPAALTTAAARSAGPEETR